MNMLDLCQYNTLALGQHCTVHQIGNQGHLAAHAAAVYTGIPVGLQVIVEQDPLTQITMEVIRFYAFNEVLAAKLIVNAACNLSLELLKLRS